MAVRPASAASKFALELDGKHAGYLQSWQGGNAYAQVLETPAGTGLIVKKHLGSIAYEDVTIAFNLSGSDAMIGWIQSVLAQKVVRKSGAIYTLDQAGSVVEAMQFSDALITEIAFPASDGASKSAAYLNVTFKPESVRFKRGAGPKPPAPAAKQKSWNPANFRFTLGKLATNRVAKIDGFVIKQAIQTEELGSRRLTRNAPGKLTIPNLRVAIAAAGAETWTTWFEDFVINGNADDGKELAGALTWLTPDLKTELATLKLMHVGIFRLAPEPAAAGSASVRRIVADLYCEQMSLSVTK